MKKTLKMMGMAALITVSCLPAAAQLNGTGYYRIRNASNATHYISLANDLFNYHIVAYNAGGGLSSLQSSDGQARALACAGKYLQTDIHMIEDEEWIDPSAVIYAQRKSTTSNDYNLIGQGTSLLTLTTGTYDATYDLEFTDRYITIEKVSGSGATTLYTAKIELKSSTYVFLIGYPTLGIRYFVDNEGTFAISESSSAANAKWYVEPVTHFNVRPTVEFNGKYYTTIKVPFAFKLSNNVEKAYTISAVDNGVITYTEIAVNGGTVPAGTPVILECSSNVASECQLIPTGRPDFTAPDVSVTTQGAPRATDIMTETESNKLIGTYYCNTDGDMIYTRPSGTGSFTADHRVLTTNKYVLGITHSGKLGFVPATGDYLPANKAWMNIPGEFPWAPAVTHIPGDVNHDGNVNVQDVTLIISHILGAEIEGKFCLDCADADGDHAIDVNDVTATISTILEQN